MVSKTHHDLEDSIKELKLSWEQPYTVKKLGLFQVCVMFEEGALFTVWSESTAHSLVGALNGAYNMGKQKGLSIVEENKD